MSFQHEILDRWVSQGVGVIGVTLFQSSRAVNPFDGKKSFLVIIATGGSGALRVHDGSGNPIERPSASVIAHAPSYPLAEALAKSAYDALGGAQGLHNIVISGVSYLSITARQHFVDLELDDAQRARVAFNIDAEKEPS